MLHPYRRHILKLGTYIFNDLAKGGPTWVFFVEC